MIDFVKLCKDHNIPYADSGHHHCHEGWVQTHCPFCAGGRSGFHLGFSLTSGKFNCWRCGPLRFGLTLRALLEAHSIRLKYPLKSYETNKRYQPKEDKGRPHSIKPPPGAQELHQAHKRYLKGRAFDPSALVRCWNLLGTRNSSRAWNWRVIIPIKDMDARVVAYQGRTISEIAKPKYKMTDNNDILINPLRLLYGIDQAHSSRVVVVEGATGVWRLGPGAVATLGIDWSANQADILREFPNRFILYDPEPKAQQRAEALAEWLSIFPGTTEIITGFKTDPGELTPRRAKRIMRKLGF